MKHLNDLATKQEKEREKEKQKTIFRSKKRKKTKVATLLINSEANFGSQGYFTPEIVDANTERSRKMSTNMNFIESAKEIYSQRSIDSKIRTSKVFQPVSQTKKYNKTIDRVNEIVSKTQNRYKLKTTTKETKFNEKIKEFTKLDTFINVKTMLHKINMVNRLDFKGENNNNPYLPKIDSYEELNQSNSSEGNSNHKPKQSAYFTYNNRKSQIEANEGYLNEEELAQKLGISLNMASHLTKEIKRKSIPEEFEKNLLREFEDKYKKYSQKTKKIPEQIIFYDENDQKLKNLEKFVEQKLKENTLTNELNSGKYFEKYKLQSEKVLKLLKKTTQNIYSKKVQKLNEALQEKNELISHGITRNKASLQPKNSIMSPDISITNTKKTEHSPKKGSVFITQGTFGFLDEHKIKNRIKSIGLREDFFPSLLENDKRTKNIHEEVKRKKLRKNYEINKKMQRFIKSLDDAKYLITTSNDQDLKEINKVQSTLDEEYNKLKSQPDIPESLKTTFDKLHIFRPKKNKYGKTYLNIGSIVAD